MTDNEIIKALECCKELKYSECPKKTNLFITDCDVKLCDEVLDLINRQQAEIERLQDLIKYQKQTIKDGQEKNRQCVNDLLGLADTATKEIKKAKAEVVKAFAERLETPILSQLTCSTMEKKEAYYFCLDKIDNLVKEMTEEGAE